MTYAERAGNPVPRIARTPAGMLNSVGLQNPGVDAFLANEASLPQRQRHRPHRQRGGQQRGGITAHWWSGSPIRTSTWVELNISCPNVKQGRSFRRGL